MAGVELEASDELALPDVDVDTFIEFLRSLTRQRRGFQSQKRPRLASRSEARPRHHRKLRKRRRFQSQRRPKNRRKLRKRRALNREPIKYADDLRENELIFHLQEVVYLAVRNGCRKPVEIAADELLKRWKHLKLLDFYHFDDQVCEIIYPCAGGDSLKLPNVLSSVLPVTHVQLE